MVLSKKNEFHGSVWIQLMQLHGSIWRLMSGPEKSLQGSPFWLWYCGTMSWPGPCQPIPHGQLTRRAKALQKTSSEVSLQQTGIIWNLSPIYSKFSSRNTNTFHFIHTFHFFCTFHFIHAFHFQDRFQLNIFSRVCFQSVWATMGSKISEKYLCQYTLW